MLYWRGVLLCYEAVIGVRVSIEKSSIFSISADRCVEKLADIMGIWASIRGE